MFQLKRFSFGGARIRGDQGKSLWVGWDVGDDPGRAVGGDCYEIFAKVLYPDRPDEYYIPIRANLGEELHGWLEDADAATRFGGGTRFIADGKGYGPIYNCGIRKIDRMDGCGE